MITLEEDYNLKEIIVTIRNIGAARTTPRAAPLITVQLKPPVVVQIYQPWHATTVRENFNHDYKAVPWAYQLKRKGKMIETVTTHVMTRSE